MHKEIEKLINKADKLIEKGKISEAKKIYKEALEHPLCDPATAMILREIAKNL